MSKDLAYFNAKFDDMNAFISMLTDKVREDYSVNTGDLDAKVAALCAEIKAAGGSIARDTQPMMSDMIAKLDELAQALEDFSAKHSQRIQK